MFIYSTTNTSHAPLNSYEKQIILDVISQALLIFIKGHSPRLSREVKSIKMLSLLVVIACLLQFIQCSNLALTFDANNSVCTASCSTCSDSDTTLISEANHNDTLLLELLNATRSNEQAIKETREAIDGIIRSLSIIKNTTTSNAGAINDILLLVEDLLMLHNQTSSGSSPLPTSCQEVKNKQPNSPSGMYLLATANNGTINTYCNMEELCGSGGGWTRLAYLDMTDSTENCPSGFRLYQSRGATVCGRATSSVGSCTSVQFPSNGISYSQVCGRVTGYQYAAPDAIHQPTYSYRNNINSYYVDGVSITRGSPRQHVWTLMAGFSDLSFSSVECPCNNGSTVSVPSFIGNNYFCESGNTGGVGASHILFTSDPLWDGQGCGSTETACCNVPGIPWFHRDYGSTTTTDYIELRVCGDERTDWEDSPVSYYEIYVK